MANQAVNSTVYEPQILLLRSNGDTIPSTPTPTTGQIWPRGNP